MAKAACPAICVLPFVLFVVDVSTLCLFSVCAAGLLLLHLSPVMLSLQFFLFCGADWTRVGPGLETSPPRVLPSLFSENFAAIYKHEAF